MLSVEARLALTKRAAAQIAATSCMRCGHPWSEHGTPGSRCWHPRVRALHPDTKPCRCKAFADPCDTLEGSTR